MTSQYATGSVASAGNTILRHDIQLLADRGLVSAPVTTWPLAWASIVKDISTVDDSVLEPAILAALHRVQSRAERETRAYDLRFDASIGGAVNRAGIRSYEDTPRGDIEVSLGGNWNSERFTAGLNVQYIDNANDGQRTRMDDSVMGINIGNWSLSLSTLNRWWGPGWDGSLILSDNARPIPAISFDRTLTGPFETKWLRWLGPWDLSIHHGQLESGREIPDARYFGMRFNFRPLASLEIGLSRSAQWCGSGRPCDFDTFTDLLLGIDNRGGQGVDLFNEPGNQLAGFDFRWSLSVLGLSTAFYGQLIGEDEAGGFPSRYLGQFGIETSGIRGQRWTYRWFGEFAGTSCQFHESSELFNCAYNHSIYRTGYRYRGRPIGHGADNDARLISTGLMLASDGGAEWRILLRYGALNRGGPPDDRNALTATRQEIASIDLAHGRPVKYGRIEIGLGFERIEDDASSRVFEEPRGFVRWRSAP